MEGSYNQSRDKSRPPHPRTASRSSTSTSHSRVMSQGASSSSSLVTSSPNLSSAHMAHRFHHAPCAKPSSPRPSSRPTPSLSREGSVELGCSTPVSSFLHERLQNQRQVEAQRTSASRSPVDMGAATQRSPSKAVGSDANRPQSSSGPEKQTTSKGPGLKEMEKVISSLHKQNFDLKLELYHRRERQSVLESKVETLEADNTQLLEDNERMREEMEKRDKAVEEAVAMIVTLEARLEQMTEERNMVHSIEVDGAFIHPTQTTPLEFPSPRSQSLNISKLEEDAHVVARMPSFMSDRSEATENLRNVYLGVRGSIISLNEAADESPDANREFRAGLASPSLSVLSESSFVSIYGKKDGAEASLPTVDEPLSLDGAAHKAGSAERTGNQNASNAQTQSSGLLAPPVSHTQSHGQRYFQPLANVVQSSYLQNTERSSPSVQTKHTLRSADSSRNLAAESGQKLGSPSRIKTRDERRNEMRRVTTDSPGGVSLRDAGMPPTPDTISSATLRRMKNSNDTLLQRQDAGDQQSRGSSHDLVGAYDIPNNGARLRFPGVIPTEIEQREEVSSPVYYQQAASIPRPRSADETTISNRRERRWSNDSKESNGSFESSIDIWLREAGAQRKSRESPGLFNFPVDANSGAWAMEAMFGPGTSYNATLGGRSNSEQMRDLMSAQQALFGATGPPRAPERQSSVQAPTGPGALVEKGKERIAQGGSTSRRRARHTRRNSDDAQMRAQMKAPAPESFAAELSRQPVNADQKRTQYPPIVGHQGARHGLKRLWRRSLGTASASPPPPTETPTVATSGADDTHHQNPQAEAATWVSRSAAVEDDRTGATPPPILRNPRQRHDGASSEGGEPAAAPSTPRMTPADPATPKIATAPMRHVSSPVLLHHQSEAAPPAAGAGAAIAAPGGRRKWLTALGRSNGGKQKAG